MDFVDVYFRAVAQQAFDDESKEILSFYLSSLRAMEQTHQQNHWLAKSYNDHLLFQRLYEEMGGLVDGTAERLIGLAPSTAAFKPYNEITNKFIPQDSSLLALLESSLNIEKMFQDLSKKTYDQLKEKDTLTLGLDDMIMANAAIGESHLYLLQQAMKEYDQ